MCGIAGILTVERAVDAALVDSVLRVLDVQVHRGPNDWGILLPSEALEDAEIRGLLERRGQAHVRTYPGSRRAPAAILGARRLSILDLSDTGRLPMGSADQRVWVTYNGEIYNFRELRQELLGRGYHFRSSGDTETLLHGYCEWGPDVVHRLRGMFAFAALDAREPGSPRLCLARDRFGIKPLYWARKDCVFQFASEVRALMAAGLMPNEPEPRGMHGFLVYGSVPTPWTTVRDVLSLPAAHRLEIDERSYSFPRPIRYWHVPAQGSLDLTHADAVAESRRLLDEAVREQLVSDVPLGVFLSGGMDSSAIVGLAAKSLAHPLTTLCVTFDEKEFSEAEYASAVARHHHTRHVEVRLRAPQLVEQLPRIFGAMDQPTIDGVNTYFVASAAREAGLTVVLSGIGGDEMFWGYPGFRRAPRFARACRVPGVASLAHLVARVAPRLGHESLEKLEFLGEHPILGPYLAVRGLFPPRRAAELLEDGRLPVWTAGRDGGRLSPGAYARLELDCYLQNQLLRDADVFGMTHSLEIRVPFLDHRLAELVFALPERYLLGPAVGNKPLLAAAVSDVYPRGLGTRAKMGFTFPLSRWMREFAPEIATGPRPETAGGRARARVGRAFRAGQLHWSRFWALSVLDAETRKRAAPAQRPGVAPRRILFLLPQVYGTRGGIPVYNQDLLRATAEVFPRSEIRVVSVNDAAPPRDAWIVGRVHFVGSGPRVTPLHRARVVWHALRAALVGRPDLIVCGHINLLPLALVLRGLTRSRVAWLALGREAWAPEPWLRWLATKTDAVVALSRYTAECARGWGIRHDPLPILGAGVDGEVFRPAAHHQAEGGTVRLLTVARLVASEGGKGVDRILHVLPGVRARHPNVRYVVAGDGDDLPRLKELARALGVAEAVEFLGYVDDECLRRLYGDAHLFVMPSTQEGFGIVFLEALACGTAVLGGSGDGTAEALLDGRFGRLVDPGAMADLEGAVVDELTAAAGGGTDPHRARRQAVLSHYGPDRFGDRVGAAWRIASQPAVRP